MSTQSVTHAELANVLSGISQRFAAMEVRLGNIEQHMSSIQQWAEQTSTYLSALHEKVVALNANVNVLEVKIVKMHVDQTEGFEGMSTNFGWMDKRLQRLEAVHELQDDLGVVLWQPSSD